MEGHGNVELTEAAVQRMKAEGTSERNKNGYLDYLAKQSNGFGKNAPSPNDGWVNRLRLHVEPAQIAAAGQLDNVVCFETGDCLIPHPDRTSNSGIQHWFNSAETYFLIGDGLGTTMKSLLD